MSTALLAASGGDTVKLFDVSIDSGDPCTLNYTPSPGQSINSVKWNHTNLVVASAGDDRKISLWRKSGHSLGTIPLSLSDSAADNIEEAISSISFSNKTSRYLCSGGSGQVVRIWDLQRKRCIKWLKGHTGSISGAMYNCKDEHLASISVNGDLIVHNLASGARAAELKDPHGQVLRVLDYSRVSRHLLALAGDDGSVHMWDTIGKSPKVSWLKQHSAPASGLSFSPSNDKIIATVGLDKKFYTFDSSTRRSTSCVSYDAPFTSLAYRDDGWILAAGTSNGRVVFYDVRGKPQPFNYLVAYGNSEAVTSLCWQRSKPIIVNEKNCSAEEALLGSAVEDSVLMPDPLPSATLPSVSQSSFLSGPRRTSSLEPSSYAATSELLAGLSPIEETPHKSSLLTGGILPRLQAARIYDFKDDMQVFSPLDPPVTPPLHKLWKEPGGSKKDQAGEKKSSPLFPSRKFSFTEGVSDIHPILDWKPGASFKQDDIQSALPSTPNLPPSSDDSATITPPEAWGGERFSDKFAFHRQGLLPSRFSMFTSGNATTSMFTGLQDPSSGGQSAMNYSSNLSLLSGNLRGMDISSGQETTAVPGHTPFSSLSPNLESKSTTGQGNLDSTGPFSLNLSRRLSKYAERRGTSGSFTDVNSGSLASPKTKKTGAETREELNNLMSRSDTSLVAEPGLSPSASGASPLHPRISQADPQQGTSSFTLQLFQRTLDETLASFQKSIHEDVRNLHIEILRQFHMQEMEMATSMNQILENQAALFKEVEALRKENERLQQLL